MHIGSGQNDQRFHGRRWLVAAVLLGLVVAWGGRLVSGDDPKSKDEPGEGAPSVVVIIDYGDGVEKHFKRIPWEKGLTAQAAVEAAAAHPRGISFKSKGSGAKAFLTQIDDLKNGTDDKNWIYSVNGELGQRSYGVTPLEPKDVLEWKFEEYKP